MLSGFFGSVFAQKSPTHIFIIITFYQIIKGFKYLFKIFTGRDFLFFKIFKIKNFKKIYEKFCAKKYAVSNFPLFNKLW